MFETTKSAQLYDRACKSLATGVSTVFRRAVTPTPLYMTHGNGPYYYDVDGHELLDYTLAWGPLIVGNNHPRLNQAIIEQVQRGYTFGAQHEGEIMLADKICAACPGVEQVIFSNTGTEAVQSALRLARAYTGREKFIKFEGHYHGWLNNVLVSNTPKPEQEGQAIPGAGGQPWEEYAHTVVVRWNDLDALRAAFVAHPNQIACVLTEPILINSGSCMPAEGFLAGVIEMCKEFGALSVFDEVITGFRIALGGGREYFHIQPDLSTYAKAIAGGFSMAAVGGRKQIFNTLSDGRTIHAGTYNGNPICTAAAIATLDILSEPGTYQRMHDHGYAIRRAIEAAGKKYAVPLVTTGVGSAFSVHLGLTHPPRHYGDVRGADGPRYNRFRAAMLEHHVQLLPAGRWYVGAVHTDRELEKVLPAIDASIKAIA